MSDSPVEPTDGPTNPPPEDGHRPPREYNGWYASGMMVLIIVFPLSLIFAREGTEALTVITLVTGIVFIGIGSIVSTLEANWRLLRKIDEQTKRDGDSYV